MLVASFKGERVEAETAERSSLFTCPGCRESVVLKRGRVVTPHFAHKAKATCQYALGETAAHLAAKRIMKNAFVERGWVAEVECEVPTLLGDRRADVMLLSPKGGKLALELQHSNISITDIARRTRSYYSEGIAVVWLPFIDDKTLIKARSEKGGQLYLERYSPRPFERWIHGHNYGSIALYKPYTDTVYVGKFSPHYLQVESKDWYDSEGELNSGGGYSYTSKRWKELSIIKNHISALRVQSFVRAENRIGMYEYPGLRNAAKIVEAVR